MFRNTHFFYLVFVCMRKAESLEGKGKLGLVERLEIQGSKKREREKAREREGEAGGGNIQSMIHSVRCVALCIPDNALLTPSKEPFCPRTMVAPASNLIST